MSDSCFISSIRIHLKQFLCQALIYQNIIEMRNFCQILVKKTKNISAFVLILCFVYGLTPNAEGISSKLRGKIALGVILSGVAYTTHALIKRDRQIAEKLRHHLGVPERVVEFERGFDFWRIEHYADRHYIFRNNRLLTMRNGVTNPAYSHSVYDVPHNSGVWFGWQDRRGTVEKAEGWKFGKKKYASNLPIFQSSIFFPFLTDMPVSGCPRWLRLCLLDSLRAPQLVSSDPGQLAIERSLDPRSWLSH